MILCFFFGRWKNSARNCNLHTDIGTATERYYIFYAECGRIVQGTVICTQTEEL
jgi:hypothetical protein